MPETKPSPPRASASSPHRCGIGPERRASSHLAGMGDPVCHFRTAHGGGGQRLYSDDDVLRATMLKRLTEQGHAISSIANHDAARLNTLMQQQNASHRRNLADSAELQTVSATVVGLSLAARLAVEQNIRYQRFGGDEHLFRPGRRTGCWADNATTIFTGTCQFFARACAGRSAPPD